MAVNKWMKHLARVEGAVDKSHNPYATGVGSGIPSVDFIFGNTHIIPAGMSAIFWGLPKSGKSLLAHAYIGNLHKNDDEAIAVKFDTEFRSGVQLTPHYMNLFGIDPDRFMAIEASQPDKIFDVIENQIAALCSDGAPIKLIVIDSVSGILGRRQMSQDGVMTMQIGDKAATIGEGMSRILPIIRKHKISVIMVAQARDEMDRFEQMKGNKFKMAGANQLKHFSEYFVFVEADRTVAGRKTMSGEELVNDDFKDFKDKSEMTGHKIRCSMKDSSLGPKGRKGEFTFDYGKGIINQHEEIFVLATKRRIVDKPTQAAYTLSNWPEDGKLTKFVGKENFLNALKSDKSLSDEIMKRVKQQDITQQQTGALPVFSKTDDEELQDDETDTE